MSTSYELFKKCIIDDKYLPDYLIQELYLKAKLCSKLNLHCIDTPIITSKTLPTSDKLLIRKFWKKIKKFLNGYERRWFFFDNKLSRFAILLRIVKGSINIAKSYRIGVTNVDCNSVECVSVTNTNMLYAYLEGYVDRLNYMRINLVYLLKKLIDIGDEKLVNNLVRLVQEIVKYYRGEVDFGQVMINLNDVINGMLTYNDVLRDVLQVNKLSEVKLFIKHIKTL